MTTEEFNSLSKAKKRVAIARDVIEQLGTRKIRANTGSYVLNEELSDIYYENYQSNNPKDLSLQKELQKKRIHCEVCAKGALFVCDVLIRNEYSSQDYNFNNNRTIKEKLDYFSKDQLDLIEMAFEGGNVESNPSFYSRISNYTAEYNEIGKAAIKFSNLYDRDKDRMVAIMKNIIKYRGTFRPMGIEVNKKKKNG